MERLNKYLAACGINGIRPDRTVLGEVNAKELYRISCIHFVDALVGTAWKNTGVDLTKEWNEHILKAIRKVVLFDEERTKLFSFMEKKGIWYLPLKGIILKDYYPAVGMRQMSDNDILFDYSFCNEVQAYMESQGYEAIHVGMGNHDVYKKAPVYNFELHRALYGETHQEGWAEYYETVKDRLVLSEGTSCGYHFTDEDFYVYFTSHAYKHYAGCGTGLRTLLDFYAYLKVKEQEMDFAYIEKECDILGVAGFEKKNRSFCRKVFDGAALQGKEALEESLSEDEKEMLRYYLTSGAYGSSERGVVNKVKRYSEKGRINSKLRYLWDRLFPGYGAYKFYAPFCKNKVLQSFIGWFCRVFVVLFTKKRRDSIAREIEVVKKTK